MPDTAPASARASLPFFSSMLFKLFGKTVIFGLVPLAVTAYLLISGYEAVLGSGNTSGLALFHIRSAFTIGILVLFIIAGGFFTDVLLDRPIRALMRYLGKIDWENPQEVRLPYSEDETGELIEALRTTVENFKRIRERDKAISEAKNEFLSIAAHQLRTPLTQIKWTIEQIRSGTLEGSKRDEYLGRIQHSVDDLIQLVGNLLNAVRIEENRFGYNFKKADLKELLTTIVRNFSDMAKTRDLSLSLEAPEGALPEALIDVDGINLVLTNLISNALNYTPQGGTITVRLAKPLHDGRLAVSVTDTGIGIPEAEKAKIFSRFFRATNAQKTHPDGSGIGLYLAKSIIERHGGTLSFDSTEGKGTTFTFSVPTEEKDLPKQERNFNDFFSSLSAAAQ